MRGQRAARDEAAAHRGTVGRLRGVDGTVDRRPAERRARAGPARRPRGSTSGSKVPITARTTCRRSSPETDQDDLTFVRALPLAEAADPSSAILVAYVMNGEPLRADHGAPFRLIVPHWYAVASVKWLKRIDVLTEPYTGEFQTGHYIYQWPDRPHEPVTAHARARPHHRPRSRGRPARSAPTPSAGRPGRAPGPITQVDVSLTGEGDWHPAQLDPPKGPYQWQDWSFVWEGGDVGATPARPGDRRRRQRPARRPAVEPAGLRQQRHRGPVRRPALTAKMPSRGLHSS